MCACNSGFELNNDETTCRGKYKLLSTVNSMKLTLQNKIDLLVSTVARNSGNCNLILICHVGCYGYTCIIQFKLSYPRYTKKQNNILINHFRFPNLVHLI